MRSSTRRAVQVLTVNGPSGASGVRKSNDTQTTDGRVSDADAGGVSAGRGHPPRSGRTAAWRACQPDTAQHTNNRSGRRNRRGCFFSQGRSHRRDRAIHRRGPPIDPHGGLRSHIEPHRQGTGRGEKSGRRCACGRRQGPQRSARRGEQRREPPRCQWHCQGRGYRRQDSAQQGRERGPM